MSKLSVRDLTPSTLEVANEKVVGGFLDKYDIGKYIDKSTDFNFDIDIENLFVINDENIYIHKTWIII